jgi:hypothetical protein
MRFFTFAATFVLFSSPVLAEDNEPCGTGLICASAPSTVVKALQDGGYRAKLDKDSNGDPSISSSTAGYNYEIYFYGCKENKNCDSLQFQVSFQKDETHTAELANKWNNKWRFGQAAVTDKGAFVVSMDVSTIGGLNGTNFADSLNWWDATMGNLRQFFKDNPAPVSK